MSDAPPSALERTVGVGGAVLLGLGSILGTGVFVSIGIAAGVAGPAVVLAVALAACVATFNGLSSAQLAARHPVSGGTYEYAYRTLHPALGFTAGWMFLCAKSASAATAALGFAGYLLHSLGRGGTPERIGIALVVVAIVTVVVASGIRRSNRANAVIVSITLAALGAFVLAGLRPALAHGGEHLRGLLPGGGSGGVQARDLLHGTALMFVAFTGYGRIATLGEEVTDPARTIPRAIVATLVVTAGLYAVVALVAVGAVGAPALAAATSGRAAPLEVAAASFGSVGVARVVAVGAVTAMLGVLLNLLLGLSRVLLAMARRQDMPSALAVIDGEEVSPRRAVIVIGALVAGLVLIGDVQTTWSFSAFTVLVYYALTNLSALRLAPEDRRYPALVSVLGLASCLGLAVWVEPRIWMAGLAVLACGWVWFAVARRLESPAEGLGPAPVEAPDGAGAGEGEGQDQEGRDPEGDHPG